jgi:hypothetical protein
MDIRELWKSTKGKALILSSSTVLILLLGFLAVNFTEGTLADNDQKIFEECNVNQEGHITGCNIRNHQLLGFSGDFNSESDNLSVTIDDVAAAGDHKHPALVWLYRNGYGLEQDRLDDIDWGRGEVNQSGVILRSLESASTCSVTFDLGTQGEIFVQTTTSEQQYNDEPEDSYERYQRHIMNQQVTIQREGISITDSGIACSVNLADFMDQGMELDGEFRSWSGRGPVISDEPGVYGDVKVDFQVNQDGDEFIDAVDSCPTVPGIAGKNGCPNNVPVVESVSGPRNVTVGEPVNYTVEAVDQDEDSLDFSWSNGETGEKATYVFDSKGEKTVSVTVDDGFSESSKEIEVDAENTLFGKFTDFLSNLWSVVTFSGQS